MISPQKKKRWYLCDMIVSANAVVVIILHTLVHPISTLCALDLHSARRQLYLNKAGNKEFTPRAF